MDYNRRSSPNWKIWSCKKIRQLTFLLLDYKNAYFADFDPMDEFTLEQELQAEAADPQDSRQAGANNAKTDLTNRNLTNHDLTNAG